MWGSFFCAALVGVAFLYFPGFLALLGFRVRLPFAFALAPILGIPATALLSLAYVFFGVQCNWAIIFLPQLAIGLILLLVGRRRSSDGDCVAGYGEGPDGFDGKALLLYLAVGFAVSSIMFATFLQDPMHYAQEYDNITHMGSIRCFLESGNWSAFGTTLYSSGSDLNLNPLPGSGFYPPIWYDVAAFMVSLLHVPVLLSENAVNFVFAGVVLPTSMFLFMRIVFGERKEVVLWGAASVLAFSAFPWMMIAWGPVYPNMAAFCLVPLDTALFVALLQVGLSIRERAAALLLFLFGIITLAFVQPNAVFTVGVWLMPFVVYRVGLSADLVRRDNAVCWGLRVVFSIAALVAICLIWWMMYRMPFLQAVVQNVWAAAQTKPEAFISALTLGFMTSGAQLVLMSFVLVGAFWTLRDRELLWLSFAFAIACGLFVVDVSSDGPLQHLLTGFWYADYYRVAAMAALFGVPLASMGLAVASCGAASLVGYFCKVCNRASSAVAVALCVALLVVGNVVSAPAGMTDSLGGGIEGGNNSFRLAWQQLFRENNVDYIYTTEEKEFVSEARALIPEGALVINNPNDGSCFSYVADDLRIYYRYLRSYGEGGESPDSELIRSRLDSISYDDRVKQAVENVGGYYVLQLDQGRENDPDDPDSFFFFTYEKKSIWSGIDLIRDSTPGFEIVLARGDMRLYRVTVFDDPSV